MSQNQVQVVDHPHPTREFLAQSVVPGRPLVIRTGGLAALDWRSDRWTDAYLCDRVGQQRVAVQRKGGDHFGPVQSARHVRMMPFPEFVQDVMARPEGNGDWYLNIQNLDNMMMAPALQLMGDFCIPVYFRDLPVRWITVWMGHTPEWSTSRLHNDFHDNLYVVTAGSKRFKVCAPQYAPKVYTVGDIKAIHPNGVVEYRPGNYDAGPHFSRIPPGDPDPERFPEAREVPFQFAELEAGDLFYLPAGWFHEVSSKGRHISVNFWADPPNVNRLAAA